MMTTNSTFTQSLFTLALLCDPGCEPEAALEVQELLQRTARSGVGYVVIEGCSLTDMATLCYRSQTASRVLVFIADGRLTDPEELDVLNDQLLAFDYSPFLRAGGTFKVLCERIGEHGFQAHDVELKLGEILFEGKHWPVRLEKPDMTIFCAVNHDAFVVGIDLAGRDLGKREYRAFHTRRSLRATVAYAAVRAVGFTKQKLLVDPLMSDGSLAIEAALFGSGMSPQHFTKQFSFLSMPFASGQDFSSIFIDTQAKTNVTGFAPMVSILKMVRANAKLAGVMDVLTLTKCELDWLVTKFDETTIDFIVSSPPASGKSTPLKIVEKQHDDLFAQTARLLNRNGRMLLVVEKSAEFLNPAERHGFTLEEERAVWMHDKKLLFLKFRRP